MHTIYWWINEHNQKYNKYDDLIKTIFIKFDQIIQIIN
jgi:hypothetical protein